MGMMCRRCVHVRILSLTRLSRLSVFVSEAINEQELTNAFAAKVRTYVGLD